MLYFAFYERAVMYAEGEEPSETEFEQSREFFNFTYGNKERVINNGKLLFESMPVGSPRTGLSMSIFWNFIKTHKTERDHVTLLAYLALKSIIGKSAYKKITSLFWYSRMAGMEKRVKYGEELPPEIRKYMTDYHRLRIKEELALYWGLKYPKINSRGFYASFSLELEDLTYYTLNKTRTRAKELLKQEREEALIAAKKRLGLLP